MASSASLLLTPTQSDLSARAIGLDTVSQQNRSDFVEWTPRAPGSRLHYHSTSSSTAYEPHQLESHTEKDALTDDTMTFRSSTTSWIFEIIAIIISSGAVVALVALLYRENGKALSSWTLAVTLNTVVATLGTLARTSLAFAVSACIGQQKWSWLRRRPDSLVAWERFDEASRGPWGGARLFVWLRARHWAALGALVTVGTIAFDPFLQAVISNYGQMDTVATLNDATIGQSLRIDSGTIIPMTGAAARDRATDVMYLMGTGSRPDFGFISSVYNGFQNTSTFRNDAIGAECTTGNCSWPVFSSAAVCSSCENVSDQMQRIQRYGSKGTNVPIPGTSDGYGKGEFVAFSLPYGNIRNYIGPLDNDEPGKPTLQRTYMTANSTFEANRTISFQHLDTLLMAILVMRASDDWLASKGVWEDSRPTATECALYLCANAYQSTSEDNLVREQLLGSWAQRTTDSYKYNPENAYFPDNSGAGAWVESLGSKLYDARVNRTDLQLVIPDELSTNYPADMRRKFNVSHSFIFSAIGYLISYTKQDRPINGFPAGSNNESAPDETWDMLGVPWLNDEMPPVVDALWNSTNLTRTFDNVARSLTNQIRNSSPNRHQGELQKWTLHVHVEWAYLAYPVTILVAGILYVILTIVESTRLQLPVWKESALPTLLHGFDDETQKLLREDGRAAQHRLLVRFERDEKDCMRLVSQQ